VLHFVCQLTLGALTSGVESRWFQAGAAIPLFGRTMHELSIMESALSMALQQARQNGASRVCVIRLRIGVLSGVVPDALQFAFEALTPGTPAEGGELAIEHVPARFWCAACAQEFKSDDLFGECPGCHRPSGDLRAGREMEVASLEIE
jgi:hydrogenase nickel incorporation protein HypA/HybF